ncbi:hypothetical protein Esi_0144_0064 [Ectocarpus siliculosus]|uniref:Uncharacterized protein n=1 Tax=Ectocarpus siliculosus TaxID=2880 RepID=D7FKJ1_ECTSI|nr:hypothetical protein Esi_0144_0064 [Ectocarpus siliculosus]|eukprot:CBJ29393.1 hypothetical protein Esi_0144_0064 [Ectocarpus siliculosus]
MDQRLAEEDSVWDDDVAEEGTVIVGIGDEATPADHDTVSCERGGQRSAIEVFCNELFGVDSAFDFATPHGAREGSMAVSRQRGAKNPTLMPGFAGFTSVYPRLRQALVQGWRRAATTGERVESACQEKQGDASSRQADSGQMSDDPPQAVGNPVPPTPSEVLTASSVRMMLSMASALRTTNPEALQVICSTLFDLLLETPPLVLAPLRQSPSSVEATTFRKVGEFCAELLGSANHAEHQPALRLYLALAVSKGEVSGLLEVVNCFLDRARLDAKDGGTPALLHFPGGAPPSSTVAANDTAKPERGQCRDRDAGVSAVLERLANQRVHVDPPFPSSRDDGPFGWKEVLRNLVDDSERALKGSASRYCIPPLRETAVFVLAHLDRLGAHYYLGCKGERAQAGEVGSPIPSLQKRGLDVPFCFDLAPETFRHLVDLVERSSGSIEKAVHGEDDDREENTIAVSDGYLELYVLSASLRLLNVNIGTLLGSGLGVEEFGGEGLRRSLLRCLLGLVRHCKPRWTRADFSSRPKSIPHTAGQVGRGKVAEEALRLLVDGMDLFYPSQGLQASLLSSYLRAFGTSSESHSTASHALVLELLCRTSAPEWLRSFLPERRHPTPPSGTSACGELLLGPGLESCEESPRSHETLDSFAKVLLESSSAHAVKEVRHAAGMMSVGCDSAPGAERVLMSDKLRESSKEVGQAVLRALDAVLNLRCVDAFQATKEGRVEDVDSTADIRKFLLLVLQASSNVLAAAIEARCCATAADVFERVVEAVCNGLVGTLLPSCLASALALPVDATDLLREPLQQHLVQLTRKLRLLTIAGCAPHGSAQRSPSVRLKDEIRTLQADFGVEALGQESLGSESGVGATTEHRPTKASLASQGREKGNGVMWGCILSPVRRGVAYS